ncbi:ATP-dependent helicase [Nesterenkonia flava]|uniref:ATP-dependent helicase n=1 Tax=Nesterenkonia flava TaxID=469799 RepID=A0ABU1FRR1_9MICC|nr:ATP-dependent helicase [Nesterenkonia flava]MDR5711017.1 ATP-dependent helicase [Nesterenkonia flava]
MTALERFTEATRTWFSASFGAPTPAQAGAWDSVSRGRNALVVAPTGSGKTLSAFLWSIDRLVAAAAESSDPTPPAGSAAPSPSVVEGGASGSRAGSSRARTRVLYISPLKALGVDIERNLRSPLVGIAHTARRLGLQPPEITVGVRTGDTTSKERRDLVRNPPDILITTPESLYLMLTSQARQTLTGVETVIVDEIHALAGTKRGAHLALSLERLDALLTGAGSKPAQRIGLSATVEPRSEVARFLGGRREVDVVAPPSNKQWDITVSVPVPDLSAPEVQHDDGSQPLQPSIWPHVEHKVVELVAANRSTIVFVNSRRLAEKLTGRINEIWAEKHAGPDAEEPPVPELAKAHHGSVSKEQRKLIEEDLKSGRLKCVVATSSLELGIDMGAVDLVIQVEAPHAVSAGLQRIGRAGHQVGEVSVGWFFPKHRGDLVSTAVVVERMLSGTIEALHIPKNPLDILAQQTIAASAMDTLEVEVWFETVRRAAPFASLPRSAFEATLDLLAGKYPSDRFADLRPRIVWDRDAGTITGRPGAQRLAVTSGGTIPDRGLFGVYLVGSETEKAGAGSRTGGRRVGELDEEMVYESRVGDVFALGATSWRIEEITFDRVLVSPAFGQPASLPFWRGDGIGRPAELGEALGAFTREMHESDASEATARLAALGLDTWAQENLLRYLHDQQTAAGAVPSDKTLVVERTRDELGDWRIILHSPYGMQVHAPWALAVGERLHERYGLDGAAFASDDGIVLRVPMMDEDPPGAELFRFELEELEELVIRQVSSSALFAGRFREAAARALLLPRQNPGKRTPLWQQRQRSSQLLEVAHAYPDFPIIMESMREVLQDVYDLPALDGLIRRISQRRVRLWETTTSQPSPFAQSILFGYIAQYLYEGDSPLAERRAAALSVDPQLLNELLGRVELREFLDTGVITEAEAHAQRLAPARRLPTSEGRGPESVADLLRLLGPLTTAQLALRLRSASEAPDPESPEDTAPAQSVSTEEAALFAEQLIATQRAFRLHWRGEERIAAVEDAARLRDGLGAPIPPGIPQTFLDPVEDPLGDLIGRYARTHGPFTSDEVSDALGLPGGIVVEVLRRLVEEQRVVEGLFRPDREPAAEIEYVDAEMLRRIRRRSLAALRAQVEPVPPRAYAQFLTQWQSVTVEHRLEGAAGVAEVLAQLSGLPAPASAWESFILPARVPDYQPAMLDELLSSGEVLAAGRGPLSGHDGWVAFYPREDAHLIAAWAASPGSAPGTRETPASALPQRILQVLSRGGAWFPDAVRDQLIRAEQPIEVDGMNEEEPSSSREDQESPAPVTSETVKEALWDLFWSGRVLPDSFAAVRERLLGGRTAHKQQTRPSRSRHSSRRTALRRAVQEHRQQLAAGPSGARWALVPDSSASPTEIAHTRAEILLDRYGVVTRGSVTTEQTPGGFAGVYKVLAAAEEAGQVRRGYFIEHLGAAQFTTSATVDRLRETADALADRLEQPDRHPPDPIVLAATDPANPYGAALDWPAAGEEAPKARPGRKAGAVVVLHEGELVLYMERGGRTLLLYAEQAEVLAASASALVRALRRAQSGRIAVEKVNGASVLNHPIAEHLRAAGFHSSPSGLRLAP